MARKFIKYNQGLFFITILASIAVFIILYFSEGKHDQKIEEIPTSINIPMVIIRKDSLISLLKNYKQQQQSMTLDSSNINELKITFNNITNPGTFYNYKENLVNKSINGFSLKVIKDTLTCTLSIKRYNKMFGVEIPSDILYSISINKATLGK